ncbi:tetratricopeptide repeat protein, partial [Odoribacter sp. OttesenSCG-928-A06]|nr:tetratricopeptide repeat protein [Odoribacter sp. OttesenSCG-928-A06]
IEDLDEVVAMNPNNILIFFNRGLLKYEIKDLEGAYADFSESIRLYPDFVKAYLARASVNNDLQNYTEADRDHGMALAIMDKYKKMKAGDKNALLDTTENFNRLIDFNAKNDRIKDVINGRMQDKNVIVSLQDIFYVQNLSIDSLRQGKVQYYNRHVMEYNQKHGYKQALSMTNKRNNAPVDLLRADVKRQTELIEKSGLSGHYFLRGILYMDLMEYTHAIDDFSRITEKTPSDLLALFNGANARMFMYDYIEAIDDKTSRYIGEQDENKRRRSVDYSKVLEGYYKCLEIDPSFVFALFNVANVYVKSEKIEQAIETYTRVINMDPSIAEAYFNRGILNIYIGKKSEASADLSKAGEKGIIEAYNIIKRYCN